MSTCYVAVCDQHRVKLTFCTRGGVGLVFGLSSLDDRAPIQNFLDMHVDCRPWLTVEDDPDDYANLDDGCPGFVQAAPDWKQCALCAGWEEEHKP